MDRVAEEAGIANDPFTFDIIGNSLQAISDEMFVAMRKTAMSPIIYEVLDMGTGITNAKGEMVSSGAGLPAFIGVLDKAVKVIVKKFADPGMIQPGDVFATNDPYHGGVTHLNDVIFAMPVFAGSDIIAWVANIAHWSDVGGMVPGSMATDASEIFQEGLRLPAIKVIDKGEPIAPVMEIMTVNSRFPDFLRGDMWAAIAATRIGERRLMELAQSTGSRPSRAPSNISSTTESRWRGRGLPPCRRGASSLPMNRTTARSTGPRSRLPTIPSRSISATIPIRYPPRATPPATA